MTITKNDDLLFCPFCGSHASGSLDEQEVKCSNANCTLWRMWFSVEEWQTRFGETVLLTEIDRLQNENKRLSNELTEFGNMYEKTIARMSDINSQLRVDLDIARNKKPLPLEGERHE